MPNKPNLFIIGAMKSGTTSLHNYLHAHPEIAMSEEKEPGYFVEELNLKRGESWYLNLFNTDKAAKYWGESSTHYTKLPLYKGVAERIYQFNPQAKLIYVMRDPFERLVSHYWHAVRDVQQGGERKSLLEAVHQTPDYLAFSEYVMQLAPYLRLFGSASVYTLTFEALRDAPNREINKIFAWLGLATHELPVFESSAHNRKPEQIIGVAGGGLLNRIQYSATWDCLSKFAPASLKHWAKKIAYTEISEDAQAEELAKLKTILVSRLHRQVNALSHLLGREFPEWPTVTSPL
jgi:hypothetical protein